MKLELIGTFRSEDGDGSENVAEKVNSRSVNLHRDYSRSLTLSNAGGSPNLEFLRTISKFTDRERKFRRRLCTSSVQREIGHFQVVVVQ